MGLKLVSLERFQKEGDGTNSGEPKAFQQDNDITNV